MEGIAPFVLPATGGSAILAAFVYLLRYVNQLHTQLGAAQAATATAATERATRVEAQLAQLQLDYAAVKAQRYDQEARWARRAAAARIFETEYPSEYVAWKFFDARIDEALRGAPGVLDE